MKILGVILFLLALATQAEAQELKVMTFNTMCDLCGDREVYDRFKDRIPQIVDTIKRHNPDLISLQEIRTKKQLKKINRALQDEYEILYSDGIILNYADPALLVRKNRFKIIAHSSYWLGPKNGRFSFGWRVGIPRKLRFSLVKDRLTNQSFYFVGSHLDNSTKNKEPSAVITNRLIRELPYPTIFAADTNLKTQHHGYDLLLENLLVDSFEYANPEFISNSSNYTENDACNKSKAPTFPACRIDHILLTKDSPWLIERWLVDIYRYTERQVFASDHRATIVHLRYK